MKSIAKQMPPISIDRAAQVLSDLIALRSVNPMGRPYDGAAPIERPVHDYLERLFTPFGVRLERQSCSPIHESLLIEIPGRTDHPGTLFESHADTVPADDWMDAAFIPYRSDDIIFGRGACDDKGSLTAMALAILSFLECGVVPPQPAWLLVAGDEEYAQTGIKHFLENCHDSLGRAVFGEPTNCLPVVQHKGTIRWDVTVQGRSAHTSNPSLGRNAILDMIQVINRLQEFEEKLQRQPTNELTGGPTLTVTMIQGGRTRNVVPDECTIAVDLRIQPGMDGRAVVDELFAYLDSVDAQIVHQPFQCFAPALVTPIDDPFVVRVVNVCSETFESPIGPKGVPYGSDAGWIPRGTPAVVLGPGDIADAHAVDEHVALSEIVQAAAIYRNVLLTDWL